MKLDSPLNLVVSVRETGSNNAARILGHGITASSTNSAKIAVESAVEKLISRNKFGPVKKTITRMYGAVNFSHWSVTLVPFAT